MLGRRRVVAALGLGAIAARWPATAAATGTTEGQTAHSPNCSFVQEMQASIRDEVSSGAPPDLRRSVVCPLCGDRLSFSA